MNITINADFTSAAAAQRLATQRIPQAVRWILQDWSARTVKNVKEGLAGKYLNRKTGHLANSVGRAIKRDGEHTTLTIGTNVTGRTRDVPYARIQDEGGTIVPRRARALTIPVAGTKGVAANFPNMFLLKRPGKPPLLVEKTAKGALKLRFVLVSQVTLKATGWWSIPWAEAQAELKGLYLPENVLRVAGQLAAAAKEN